MLARQTYLRQLKSVTVLQAGVRCMIAMKTYRRMKLEVSYLFPVTVFNVKRLIML